MKPGRKVSDPPGECLSTSFQATPGSRTVRGSREVAGATGKVLDMEGKPVKSYINKEYIAAATSGFELEVPPNSKPVVFDLPLTD